jgi:23S rRNA pseudouridine2605 synthase
MASEFTTFVKIYGSMQNKGRRPQKSTDRKKTEKKQVSVKSSEDKKSTQGRFNKGAKSKPEGVVKSKSKSFSKSKTAGKKYSTPLRVNDDGKVRINKYLADAGICSRREAEVFIKSGLVEVNGDIITDLSTRIGPEDTVKYGGETLRKEKLRYVLLNKPKDYITTSDDPDGRKTVMTLVANACRERIYPVGRLDRQTTGLLLFTNDGDMAKKLTHPRYGVKKVYLVEADKKIDPKHKAQMIQSVMLEDGEAHFDEMASASKDGNNRTVIVGLRSGRNRIVRRIFEHFGYEVTKLDRIAFAGLTKEDLTRGKWRHLTEKEIGFLKMVK